VSSLAQSNPECNHDVRLVEAVSERGARWQPKMTPVTAPRLSARSSTPSRQQQILIVH
jgi:hypothetical protein